MFFWNQNNAKCSKVAKVVNKIHNHFKFFSLFSKRFLDSLTKDDINSRNFHEKIQKYKYINIMKNVKDFSVLSHFYHIAKATKFNNFINIHGLLCNSLQKVVRVLQILIQ